MRVEYRYRTFEWYRRGKKTAQSGFLLSVFLVLTGLFYLIMTMLSLPSMVVAEKVLDPWVYFLIFFFGAILLFNRSGQSFKAKRSKRSQVNF